MRDPEMLFVRPGTVADIMALNLRDWDAECIPERERYAKARAEESYAMLKDGTLVAVGGFVPFWPGVAETWILCDRCIWTCGMDLLRTCASIIKDYGSDHSLHRLQALCRADWKEANNFTRRLGFEQEGVLKHYGRTGIDHIMWARYNLWAS